MPGVLVFTEVQNGKLRKTSREALSIGRKLAAAAGGDRGSASGWVERGGGGRRGGRSTRGECAGGRNENEAARDENPRGGRDEQRRGGQDSVWGTGFERGSEYRVDPGPGARVRWR